MMLVNGKTYRTNPPQILRLSTLKALKRDFDLTWPQVMAWFQEQDADRLENATTFDLMVETEFEGWVYAWVVNADGPMTRAEFEEMEIGDIQFTAEAVTEEPTVPDEVDPTTASDLTGSGQADADQLSEKRRQQTSTKTSKKRSAAASS